MRKKIKALAMILLAFCAGLMGCRQNEVREVEVVPNVVRVYDVESQNRSHIVNGAYASYQERQVQVASSIGDGKELAEKVVAGYEGVKFKRHEYRMGIFTGIAGVYDAPFASSCNTVKRETEIDVEYVMMDSWEDVRADLEKNKNDGITKIVLFNNAYDESIIKELNSGRYADMEKAMEEAGLYDEALYDQAVMAGGRVEGVQYAVPLLYNVSGMIHGEKNELWYDNENSEPLTPADYETGSLSYEEFIAKLNEAMVQWNQESMDVPFLSVGFTEEEVDIFLLASGMDWDAYEDQKELFELLLEYRKTYQETQVDTQEREMSNQQLYMMYLKINERLGYEDEMAEGTMEDLSVELAHPSLSEHKAMKNITMAETYLNRTRYFVECSAAEDIAFHSVLGTLNYSRTYCNSAYLNGEYELSEFGKMEYWPIGITGDSDAYAAQLVSYAAVVDGGSTELAATVLKEMLNEETLGIYGLSPCKEVREKQISDWTEDRFYPGAVRTINRSVSGEYSEGEAQAFWNNITGSEAGPMARSIAAEQLREQLDNVVTASIPDREALSIWQDTLTEAVDSGISAEAGFELLCERMDAWYE